MKLRLTLLLFATTSRGTGTGLFRPADQSHWSTFATADGLPENACISVTIVVRGKVFVRHAKANTITVPDGYGIANISAPGR